MVHGIRFVTSIAVSLTLIHSVQADCLVRQLPEDGAWACFYCTEEFDDGTERSFYITIKSVGRVMVDEQPCRWIELKYHSEATAGLKGAGSLWKLLIPEKQIAPDGDPLNHVIKAWRKSPDENPIVTKVEPVFPRLYLIMPPAIKGLRKVKERQAIDWQQGQLVCEASLEGTARHQHPVEIVETRYRLAIHDQVPFGVAGAKLEIESDDGYKGIIQYWLTDMGTDATSELAEAE